jgi:hypothetical protein
MSEDDEVLSFEDTLELLGARAVDGVSPPALDPLGLQLFASQIAQRLASKGGRPTDSSWELSRKVPMKRATWERLNELSRRVKGEGAHAAPGQIAALALERGLDAIEREGLSRPGSCRSSEAGSGLSFSEKILDEAREIYGAIEKGGLWG